MYDSKTYIILFLLAFGAGVSASIAYNFIPMKTGVLTGSFFTYDAPSNLNSKKPGTSHKAKYGTAHLYNRSTRKVSTLFKKNLTVWADAFRTSPYRVRTNGKGLREKEFSQEKPHNTTRILVLGDSFVYGWGVNRSDRFTEVLERKLQSRHSRDIEIINAGVPGWGMKDYFNYLKHRGIKYEPDMVIVSFISNDWHSANQYEQWSDRAIENLSEDKSNYSHLEIRKKRQRLVLRMKHEYLEDRNWSETGISYIQDINSLLEDRDIKSIYFATDRIYHKGLREFLKNWSDRENTKLVFSPEKFRDSWDNRKSSPYRTWDGHPNPKGHILLAKRIYPKLAKMLQIPEQASFRESAP